MRQPKNPQKTLKVLYLYLTVPLLLVALMLGLVAWAAVSEKKESSDRAVSKATQMPEISKRGCSEKGDCLVGESCLDSVCVNPLKERTTRRPAEVKAPEEEASAARWAAIITAILGGLTGLLGAVTHTVIAFERAKERRGA